MNEHCCVSVLYRVGEAALEIKDKEFSETFGINNEPAMEHTKYSATSYAVRAHTDLAMQTTRRPAQGAHFVVKVRLCSILTSVALPRAKREDFCFKLRNTSGVWSGHS